MEKPIINSEFLLQKMPGKGGWTFALIPELADGKKFSSLWLKVKGSIDNHQFEKLSLAKIKDGGYFFPIRADIRKAIQKQAGDYVTIILYEDFSVFEIPEEIAECLKLEPNAYPKFIALKETRQKEFVSWILSAKREETKAARINTTIDKVLKGETLYTKME